MTMPGGLTYSYTVEGPYSERLTLLNYVNYLYQHYMDGAGVSSPLG